MSELVAYVTVEGSLLTVLSVASFLAVFHVISESRILACAFAAAGTALGAVSYMSWYLVWMLVHA
jgi:hypothetical protein